MLSSRHGVMTLAVGLGILLGAWGLASAEDNQKEAQGTKEKAASGCPMCKGGKCAMAKDGKCAMGKDGKCACKEGKTSKDAKCACKDGKCACKDGKDSKCACKSGKDGKCACKGGKCTMGKDGGCPMMKDSKPTTDKQGGCPMMGGGGMGMMGGCPMGMMGKNGSASTAADSGDKPEGLDGLNAADRAAAEKQKTCPVTGALLGSMGTPVKVKVKGRVVFLCCAGCKGKIQKHPDEYLKKLDKKSKD
jgi:hypothetical protein